MIFDINKRTITTENLILRMFQRSDVEELTRLCNNYNIYKYNIYMPYPYTIKDAYAFIQNHTKDFDSDKRYIFAITDKETGKLYGSMGLTNYSKYKNGELGYWIGEEYWGRGIGTEACSAIIKFAFTVKGYHRVHAKHFEENLASGKVMEKLGMKKEGLLVDHIIKDSKYVSLVCYGIVNPISNTVE